MADLQRRTGKARLAGREVVSLSPRRFELRPEAASDEVQRPLSTGLEPQVLRAIVQDPER